MDSETFFTLFGLAVLFAWAIVEATVKTCRRIKRRRIALKYSKIVVDKNRSYGLE